MSVTKHLKSQDDTMYHTIYKFYPK